ncbi:MAG: nickel pincer cofactor biosynthesis protein LarB [Anaerolineales bacterium]
MDSEHIRKLLEQVRTGAVTVEDAFSRLKDLPYEDLGFARLDTHRGLRQGFPEVIFCPGKTTWQIVDIFERMAGREQRVMAARATAETAEAVRDKIPEAVYHAVARIITLGDPPDVTGKGTVLVISAGTADIPVADEAAVTAEMLGSPVERLFDVGVAGIHRLLDRRETLFTANVLVVVAGMDGALPSVVGGLVGRPVIAVPTSVGYGASFGGLAALLTMLNSCAPGVTVVNIDNGFGAGYNAHIMNR